MKPMWTVRFDVKETMQADAKVVVNTDDNGRPTTVQIVGIHMVTDGVAERYSVPMDMMNAHPLVQMAVDAVANRLMFEQRKFDMEVVK